MKKHVKHMLKKQKTKNINKKNKNKTKKQKKQSLGCKFGASFISYYASY